METHRWQKIEKLYHTALDLSDEERGEYLLRETAGDRALLTEVQSLLTANQKSGDFLREPAFPLGLQVLTASQPALEANQQFGKYTILGSLGSGGMGEVYLAKDEQLGRKVALKLLPRDFAENPVLRNRFEREARIAASISHPNIAHIYETGEIESQLFIAMEYVEGKTLRECLRDGENLSAAEALKIASQIASALAAAHEAGIIHRDIKPENVMLRPDGYAKVLDFGIAKHGAATEDFIEKAEPRDEEKNLTEYGLLLGTIRYMSPEQLRGETIDGRADIWSLGAVLYEMLVGRPAFPAKSKDELVSAILEKEPTTIKDSTVSPVLLEILRRALAKDRAQRYQTAAEIYADLRKVPGSAEKPPTASQSRRLLSDKTALAAVILLAAGLVGAVYLFLGGENKPVTENTEKTPLNFTHFNEEGRVHCAAISPDGGRIAYVLEREGLQSIRLREIESGAVREIVPPAAGNDFEGVCLSFSPGGDFIYYGVYESDSLEGKLYRRSLAGGDSQFLLKGIDCPVSFSPDGEQMVFMLTTSNFEKLIIANADGSDPKTIITRTRPQFLSGDCYPAWSPDGKTIAFASGILGGRRQMHVTLYEVETGSERNLTAQPLPDVRQIGWLPGGAALVLTSGQTIDDPAQIYRVSYPQGEITPLTNDIFNYTGVIVARQAARLVTVASEDNAQIWTIETEGEKRTKQVSSGKNDSFGLAWGTSEQIVYGSNAGGNLDLWMFNAGGGRRQITFDAAHEYRPDASSDGRYIVFSSNLTGVFNLWRINADGSNPVRLTNGTGEFNPRISADNRSVVYHRLSAGDPISVWKVSIDGGAPVQLHTNLTTRADVSPDSSRVASTYRESDASAFLIGIYPLDGTRTTTTLKPLDGARLFVPLRWSPDGKSVTYVVRKDGADNLWSHPVDGKAAPRQITNFTSDRIYSFDFAPNGNLLALARGNRTSHTVLLEGLK